MLKLAYATLIVGLCAISVLAGIMLHKFYSSPWRTFPCEYGTCYYRITQ